MDSIYRLHLLVVEDDPGLRALITDILRDAGFRSVRAAGSCGEARRLFAERAPDGVLLDIMLPDGDGFHLMEEWRLASDMPILFLSARDADEDRLRGLGLGADDYIVKPFLPRELTLRLTAVLRRAYARALPSSGETLRLGDAQIDWGSGTVSLRGRSLPLTAKEFALLRKLADNRGNIVTIDALCGAAWGDELFGYENTLMVHIRRLREKIEAEPSRPRWLLTVRGLGYKLAREEPV